MTVTSDHRTPPWGIAPSVAWLLLAFGLSTLVSVAFYGVWLHDRPKPDPRTFDGVLLSIGALTSIPVQVAVLCWAARVRRWSAADYFALTVPRRGEIIMAVIAVIALDLTFNLVLWLLGRDIVTPFQVEAYRTAQAAGWLLWLWIAIVIFAPVGEEIAFRGFLFRGLATPGREPFAIVVIAFAWALLHIQYDWMGILQVFVIGLMLGFFRWASGSTALTILMHVLINFEAMIETAIKVEYFP
jgi:membrane protease YdiL (CAAX protease family)